MITKQLIYNFIHFAGLIGLFFALGASVADSQNRLSKLTGILHGIGMFLILLGGFGLLSVAHDNQFHWWVIAKLIIWLLLGGTLVLARKRLLNISSTVTIVLSLGALAAALGVFGKAL